MLTFSSHFLWQAYLQTKTKANKIYEYKSEWILPYISLHQLSARDLAKLKSVHT